MLGAKLRSLVHSQNAAKDALLRVSRRSRIPGDRQPVSEADRLHADSERERGHQRLNGARISAQNDFGYAGSCSPSACTLLSRGRNQVPNTRSQTITVFP